MLLLRRLVRAGRSWGTAARGLASGAPREAADAVVVGAGVVGLAAARALAMAGREVVVVEAAPSFGTGTSSRNSEVIHAGIYYPPRSLKVPKLDMLLRNAKENGVDDLQLMEGSEAMEMEPELRCLKALLSPSTGIIDSHSLMLSLLADAENLGTTISYNTSVISGHVGSNGLELHVCESKDLQNYHVGSHVNAQLVLLPKLVINSAGLSAVPLAKQFHGLDQAFVPTPHYARGCYFTLSQTKSPFSRLIYPLPEDGGIGVHVTLDLNGLVRFGPDVEWISDGAKDHLSCFLNKFDYSVNPNRCSVFYPVVRKYFPNLKDGSLEPGYSGIRPKLSGPGQPPSDFVIQGWDVHGVPGLVNLFGIESPGLTSSLAIAEHIVSKYL
ncbi:L-2-hydroxyglutarate dehydrogenase, mitochondrial [Zea mays]|uniref:L-2-hydroxyglutarate dehydrogenase, mitochondrial n=1 Tax=Zea mays TaxID=4577 RepID=A0A3L6FFI2_MAIZE|nr:L-2-hydroxyglutarate dehydrogenase, mitochondrial [Zea mays]